MNYWILKTEPEAFSWERMRRDKTAHWDGVRNHQAHGFLRQMKIGDLAFFYHSGKERRVVGLVEVIKPFHPDHTDPTGKFGMVDVKFKSEIAKPISLASIKANPYLQNLLLIRQSRLSVIPVNAEEWKILNSEL